MATIRVAFIVEALKLLPESTPDGDAELKAPEEVQKAVKEMKEKARQRKK